MRVGIIGGGATWYLDDVLLKAFSNGAKLYNPGHFTVASFGEAVDSDVVFVSLPPCEIEQFFEDELCFSKAPLYVLRGAVGPWTAENLQSLGYRVLHLLDRQEERRFVIGVPRSKKPWLQKDAYVLLRTLATIFGSAKSGFSSSRESSIASLMLADQIPVGRIAWLVS